MQSAAADYPTDLPGKPHVTICMEIDPGGILSNVPRVTCERDGTKIHRQRCRESG